MKCGLNGHEVWLTHSSNLRFNCIFRKQDERLAISEMNGIYVNQRWSKILKEEHIWLEGVTIY